MRLTSQTRTIVVSLAAVGTLAGGMAAIGVTDVGDSTTTSAGTTAANQHPQAPPDPPAEFETSQQAPDHPSSAETTPGPPVADPAPPAPIDSANGATESSDVHDDPTTFVETEPIDGPQGVVTGNDDIDTGRPTQLPTTMEVSQLVAVPKPPPPAPAPPEPIDILDIEIGELDFSAVITDFQVPIDNSIGDLAPNVHGCALQCVATAILTPNMTTPNVGLDVETRVPARIDISITNTSTGDELLFTSNAYTTQWSTTLTPLAAGIEHDLVLEAFDEDGQRRVHTHTFTTTAPLELPDQLQDNQPGCAGTCITEAKVSPTDRHDEVRVDITTNTPASAKVWISASEPGWVDGTPFLPADAIVEPTLGIRTDWSVEKAFLDSDTTYHIIVRAEDDNGVDYQVGQFQTDPPPPVNVRLTFEQIFVQWDGDPHWGGLDRGELSFVWGVHDGDLGWDDHLGYRSEAKMYGGDDVILHDNNEIWQALDQDDKFLMPGVTAFERDNPPGVQFGGPVATLRERPVDLKGYGRMNPAWGASLTLSEITSQQTCGEMGFVQALPNDYCVSFETQDFDDQEFPNIQVIVSYHIDT